MTRYTFFTDSDLAPRGETEVAEILRGAGLTVECHDDHFPPATEDHVWLEACGRNGWIALSKDRQIRYTPLAKAKIMGAGVRLFVLVGKHPHARLARNFVNTIDRVRKCIERNEDGFIARVYVPRNEAREKSRPGRVKVWLTREDWLESEEER